MNNKHLSWNKKINNNFIIASRAYFLQNHGCTCPRISPTTHNPDSCRLYPYPVGQRTSYTPSNPNPTDSNPVPVDTAPSPPQSTQRRAVSKATAVPKAQGPPLQTPSQRLKQKKNCSQVRIRSYGSYYFALASLYLLIPTNFKFEGCNWNSNGTTGMF